MATLLAKHIPPMAGMRDLHKVAAMEEIKASLVSRSAITRPVSDYLKDK